MKKPDSIISVNNDVLVGISSYDAFVYEYTNIENVLMFSSIPSVTMTVNW